MGVSTSSICACEKKACGNVGYPEPAVRRLKEIPEEEPAPVLVDFDQAVEHPGRMGDVEDEEDAALVATEEKGKEHVVQQSVSSSTASVGVPRGSEAEANAVENLMGLRNVKEKRYVYNGLTLFC